MKKRVLVVPAGTEIAHEVFECLKYSKHWELVGANGVRDHSEVTFGEIYFGIPHVDHEDFVGEVQKLVDTRDIAFVVPAHDEAIFRLSGKLSGAILVGPDPDLSDMLRFKSKLLNALEGHVPTPISLGAGEPTFPIFSKPDRGQGSRGAKVISDAGQFKEALGSAEPMLLQELLPGEEVTVDCFSSPDHRVLYSAARTRDRVSGGIATRMHRRDDPIFSKYAAIVSQRLAIAGAWFFQMKQDSQGSFKLLEVSNRIAGSSGMQRAVGVNLMDAWLHQLDGKDVAISEPAIDGLIYDRALYPRIRLKKEVRHIYVDFDDTLVFDDATRVHFRLIGILFAFKVQKRTGISLITRHGGEIEAKLSLFGLTGLFDRVIHLTQGEPKSAYISPADAIFIDDSFSERADVAKLKDILCLPPESTDILEAMLAN